MLIIMKLTAVDILRVLHGNIHVNYNASCSLANFHNLLWALFMLLYAEGDVDESGSWCGVMSSAIVSHVTLTIKTCTRSFFIQCAQTLASKMLLKHAKCFIDCYAEFLQRARWLLLLAYFVYCFLFYLFHCYALYVGCCGLYCTGDMTGILNYNCIVNIICQF